MVLAAMKGEILIETIAQRRSLGSIEVRAIPERADEGVMQKVEELRMLLKILGKDKEAGN